MPLFLAALLAAISGCRDSSVSPADPEVGGEKPVRVVLVPGELTIPGPGVGRCFTAQVEMASGEIRGFEGEWTSSDEQVAGVDEGGCVYGRDAGRATVTARSGEIRTSAEVDVSYTRPDWRFTVAVGIRRPRGAVEDEAALARIRKAAWHDLDVANAIFVLGDFDGHLHFSLDDLFFYLDDTSRLIGRPDLTDSLGVDFVVLHDTIAPGPSFYRGSGRIVVGGGHASARSIGTTVAHELAHGRGAVDLYPDAIEAEDNPISGLPHHVPSSLMSDRTWAWHPYNRYVVNRSGSTSPKLLEPPFSPEDLPPVEIRVIDGDRPAPGAAVRLHYTDRHAVLEQHRLLQADSAGTVRLERPFADATGGFRNALYHLEAEAGGRKGHTWLWEYDVALHAIRGEALYVVTIHLDGA